MKNFNKNINNSYKSGFLEVFFDENPSFYDNLTKLIDETYDGKLNAEVETISIGKLTTSNSNRNDKFNDETTDMKQTAFFQKTLNV